ncbi:hypothetical protein DENIS_2000 [Desulfonema ishimotonii]|uniref:FIST domain-containing protein n=2 Tax=Desulfonema ishimotonii TaxID=45657 RepID=A0A401FVQ2_9BACT|nr:hypothetical protein DENIS_2000 [Desulfonema ishimotonii]
MKVGIGYQNEKNAVAAGRKAALAAIRDGDIDRSDLVLAFCGGQLNADDFFKGVQSVTGRKTPVIGGSAAGGITRETLACDGHPAAIAVIQCEAMGYRIAVAGDLDRDEEQAGLALGQMLPAGMAVFERQDMPLLGFYSGVEVAPLLGKTRGLDWTGVLLVLAKGSE